MYNLTTCRFSLPIFRSTVRSGQLIMNSFTENTLLLESAVSAQEGLLHATGCSEQDELSRLSFVWKHLQLWGVEGGGGTGPKLTWVCSSSSLCLQVFRALLGKAQ